MSSLRSTVEGSGSPFAAELHYLWPTSRLVAGTSWRRGRKRSQSNASSSNSAIQRRILGHNPPIYRANAQHGVSETIPLRCSLLGRSLESKLSSAFHQLLGEIIRDAIAGAVHLSSFDGLTNSAPLIQVAWRSVAVQNQVAIMVLLILLPIPLREDVVLLVFN